MEPLVVNVPPSIIPMPLRGKTYAVGGDVWLEVPNGTTLAEVSQYMVFKGYKRTETQESWSWTVEGSKGKVYVVKLSNEGVWSCTCPGYGFRRRCNHIENTKAGHKEA